MSDESDTPTTYTLANDKKPCGRYVPPPEARYDEDNARRKRKPEPFWVRLMQWDPFPAIMVVSVLLWVGLGLAARKWPLVVLALGGVGLLVCLVGQILPVRTHLSGRLRAWHPVVLLRLVPTHLPALQHRNHAEADGDLDDRVVHVAHGRVHVHQQREAARMSCVQPV
jgi:hypothetical protein